MVLSASVADVKEALASAVAKFEAMPAQLRAGIAKEDMVRKMTRDTELIIASVVKYGTLGEAMLPDAFAPITMSASIAYDGNAVSLCFATAAYCFQVLLAML